jgi:hypothetical protein
MRLVNFDAGSDGNAISAPSPGVLARNLFVGSGVVFGEPNLPSSAISQPNSISNSQINTPTDALVAGSLANPACAVGITNLGGAAVLRLFDAGNNLIAFISSDTDPSTPDFIGLVSGIPVYRFEFDFVSGVGFAGDDLLFGLPPQPQTGESRGG